MNFLRRLRFYLWYTGHPQWDSGIVPPEVMEFIQHYPPGNALDLGCGMGTSSIALAENGWKVRGVDFIPRAIRTAQRRAKLQGLNIFFQIADVTHLPKFIFATTYELILDIGCYHGLSLSDKQKYLDQLPRLLSPGGHWLLYGFYNMDGHGSHGFLEEDISHIQTDFTLLERKEGVDKRNRKSAWLLFTKKRY